MVQLRTLSERMMFKNNKAACKSVIVELRKSLGRDLPSLIHFNFDLFVDAPCTITKSWFSLEC